MLEAKSQPQPHWAVELLLEPSEEYQNNLHPGLDYPAGADYDAALGFFDRLAAVLFCAVFIESPSA